MLKCHRVPNLFPHADLGLVPTDFSRKAAGTQQLRFACRTWDFGYEKNIFVVLFGGAGCNCLYHRFNHCNAVFDSTLSSNCSRRFVYFAPVGSKGKRSLEIRLFVPEDLLKRRIYIYIYTYACVCTSDSYVVMSL